jgi:hypothetical protein
MTSELRVDNLKGSTTGGSISVLGEGTSATTNLQQGLCKAWLNANDDSSLDDSFNISSNLDNTTGDYTYSFTNNTNNTNFCIVSICIDNNAEICHNNSRATSSYGIRIKEGDDGSTARDRPQSGTMHGDLA